MIFSKLSTIKTLLLALSMLGFVLQVTAQTTCTYQLQLFDSFGDGWDGSFVSINLNGELTMYTLGDGDDDETSQVIDIEVMTGDSISLRYGTEGTPTFQNEISYQLVDADQLVVLPAASNPEAGLIWEEVVTCPTCPIMGRDDVILEYIMATTATVSWQIEMGEQVRLEVGKRGFELGMGGQQTIAGDSTTLTNLSENTEYDVYLNRICAEGESQVIGPFSFKTPFLVPPDTCYYSLRLIDFFGDGWNGSSISIVVNDVITEYALSTGSSETVAIPALKNLPIEVIYNGGLFDEEISYILSDADGKTILSDGPSPMTGSVLTTIACPSCPIPLNPTTNPFAESAMVSWEPSDKVTNYVLEYGLQGFSRGEGLELIDREAQSQLTNLVENTTYDYYLYSVCESADTSLQVVGPITFQSIFKKDVGIQQITMPQTTCGLGVSEMIEVELRNYGALPQSLIPYQFSINEVNGGVPIPTDGFYTGIISKDSSTTIQFETPANLMNTGVYEIAVWTELEGDSQVENDTAKIIISNLPTIQTYPYSENFSTGNGGWTVDKDSRNSSWEVGIPQNELLPNLFNGSAVWATNLDGAANADEQAYLVSPCMDFSTLNTDPQIAFRYFMDVPLDSDASAALEMSINGGRWQGVGVGNEGFQWYNNSTQTAWTTNASLETWFYAEQTLIGTAGQADVRLRFVYESEETDTMGFGFGVDDIHVFEPTVINVVARATANRARAGCGHPEDQVRLLIRNSGLDTLRQFAVNYRINEGAIITEQIDTLLSPEASMVYTFDTPFSSEVLQNYHLQSWADIAGDNTAISDTTNYFFEVLPPLPLPLIENFEDEQVADGWAIVQGSPEITEAEDHNNASIIVSDNLWFGNPVAEFITASYGPLNEGDSLAFTYRLVEWSDATIPINLSTDTLTVGISTDCGATFTPIHIIHQSNHMPTAEWTKVVIPLTAYIGEGVSFSFKMKWGAGDYWWDIDDITILSCPASLALTADIVDVSGETQADGAITIIPTQGSGGYAYEWADIGSVSDSISGLLAGTYSAVVTDTLLGCQDSITVQVGILSTALSELSIIESLRIYPNPTAYSSQLDLTLSTPKTITLSLYNLVGQALFTRTIPTTSTIIQDLDLKELPKGIYWLRIGIEEQVISRKIFKID